MDELGQLVDRHFSSLAFQMRQGNLAHEYLADQCLLDNGRHESDKVTRTLGTLRVLPTEVLYMVLLRLDLQSLTVLRAVNRYMRATIDGMHEYKAIASCAPNVLRAALSSGAAAWISLSELLDLLTKTAACARCSNVGNIVYLLTFERVCKECIDRFQIMTVSQAKDGYGLCQRSLANVRALTALPGSGETAVGRLTVFDSRAVEEAAITFHGSRKAFLGFQTSRESKHDPKICRHGCKAWDNLFHRFYTPRQSNAMILAPLIDARRESPVSDWGISCKPCADTIKGGHSKLENMVMAFTREMYIEHVRECPHAKAFLQVAGQKRAKTASFLGDKSPKKT